MNTLILGSGFGLYGYLPAAYKLSNKIYLQEHYKKKFLSRYELSKFESKIVWFKNLDNILNYLKIIIIARRPSDQFNTLNKILKKRNNITHFFLEKPIAPNPRQSLMLINMLKKNRKKYNFGFIFKYLAWYKLIKKKISNKNRNIFFFHWKIKINKKNKLTSWKYANIKGGGIVRYYGIHFIKLFSDLNFFEIKYNKILKDYWEILILDKRQNTIRLIIEYSKVDRFIYKYNRSKKYEFDNPFKSKINHKLVDPRCFYLKKYISENLINYNNNYKNEIKFIKLWKKVELS